jgi:N-acetyl-anhydromuramyl-L-alanine amidase AmpD
MVPDEKGALIIPNNNFTPHRDGLRPRYIILHSSAGGTHAQVVAKYFASTEGSADPVSSHYVIGCDGSIVQCVAERDGAWANRTFSPGHDVFWDETSDPNLSTISLDLCKPSHDNSDMLTCAQQMACFQLIRNICRRWQIPLRLADADGGITGHFSLDPLNRQQCPGPFPWDPLWTFLKEGQRMLELTDPQVAPFFSAGGDGSWLCNSNGVRLRGANLLFYRCYGGPRLFGIPLANEIYLPQYPNTAIVLCERAMLVYDPDRKIDTPMMSGQCYLLPITTVIGQQLLLQRSNSLIQSLTTKLNQIQMLSRF